MAVDALILCASYALAMVVYLRLKDGVTFSHSHAGFIAILTLAYIVTFTMLGIYRRITYLSFGSQLYLAARSHLYLSALILSTIHFLPNFVPRPAVYALFIVIAPVVYVLMWLPVRKGLSALRRFDIGCSNTIAIGSDPDFHELIHRLNEHTNLQFNLVSVLRTSKMDASERTGHLDVSAIERLLNENEIDQIVFSSSYQLNGSFNPLHQICRSRGIAMRIVSTESDSLFSKIGVRDIAGIPIYVPEGLKIRFLKGILKRAFDIAGSGVLLLLFSPLFLIVAAAIKLESKGPVFFRHRRSLGADDAPFYFLKFRSMRDDADDEKETLLDQNES